MEGAGKLIDDEELREAMQEKGLGTPATRAQVIEGLIFEKYILREGRDLIPTAKAFQLMTLLRGLGVEDLTQARAHRQLGVPARRDGARPARRATTFMGEHRRDGRAHRQEGQGVRPRHDPRRLRDAEDAVPELRRHGQGELPPLHLQRHPKGDGTDGCELLDQQDPGRPRVRGRPRSRRSCATRSIGPLEGFRSKAGWPFTAELKLAYDDEIKNWKLEFDFGEDAKDDGDGEPVDFAEPGVARARARRTRAACSSTARRYVCEHAVGAHVTCDFKSGKIILQQPVTRENMTKLLATGKTDLMENFVSNKTRRKFKAFLAYDKKEGKVNFEFEPRAAKVPAAKKTAAKKKAAEE